MQDQNTAPLRMPRALRAAARELMDPCSEVKGFALFRVDVRARLAVVCSRLADAIEIADRGAAGPDVMIRASARTVLGALHVAVLTPDLPVSEEDAQSLARAAEEEMEEAAGALPPAQGQA